MFFLYHQAGASFDTCEQVAAGAESEQNQGQALYNLLAVLSCPSLRATSSEAYILLQTSGQMFQRQPLTNR